MSYVEFCGAIQDLRTRFHFSVWSWGRSARHNEDVDGHDDSMHLYGLAVDGGLDPGEDREAFERAAERLGLAVFHLEDHYHLQVPHV